MNRRFVNLLAVAKDKCDSDGLRLTEKRKRVLNLLIDAQAPLSAYEIKDMFTTRYSEDVKPMTIYRALEFLTETDLVHKQIEFEQQVCRVFSSKMLRASRVLTVFNLCSMWLC